MPLEGKDKRSAITELVNVLEASDLLLNKQAVLESVLTREQIRGTGIGFGVAIPHGKCRAVKGSVMAIGIAKNPIDFGSFDGKPVSIVVLLISALDQTVQHIQALAGISRLMLNETLRSNLCKINAAEEARELLGKYLQSEPISEN
jgi:fructose-specific phosphotransferase system IIA component